jgi:hypothetical protein
VTSTSCAAVQRNLQQVAGNWQVWVVLSDYHPWPTDTDVPVERAGMCAKNAKNANFCSVGVFGILGTLGSTLCPRLICSRGFGADLTRLGSGVE